MKGNKDKNAFRRTSTWKNFRKKLLEEQERGEHGGTYCACCGKKTKLLDCHHADEENYTDLNPDKFFLLCKMCHKCVSALEAIKPENWYKIRDKAWVDFYKRFLIAK